MASTICPARTAELDSSVDERPWLCSVEPWTYTPHMTLSVVAAR